MLETLALLDGMLAASRRGSPQHHVLLRVLADLRLFGRVKRVDWFLLDRLMVQSGHKQAVNVTRMLRGFRDHPSRPRQERSARKPADRKPQAAPKPLRVRERRWINVEGGLSTGHWAWYDVLVHPDGRRELVSEKHILPFKPRAGEIVARAEALRK